MSEQSQQDDIIPRGGEIVERFGGIRPMASKLNVPVTTVQGWKKRDAIPAIRRDEILSAAAHYDVDLKGVLSDSVANQNQSARISRTSIAEDPALSNVRPLPQESVRTANLRTDMSGAIDLRQIKSAARKTSFITTVGLLAIVAAAGVLLFGKEFGTAIDQSRHISSLENRVGSVEQQQARANNASPAIIGQTVTSLQQRVDEISAMLGTAVGSGASITDRLAALEQQLAAGSPALSGVMSRAQEMMQTPEGLGEWQSAIADLRNTVSGLQGRVDGVEGALNEAKTENDALGRTLSDISGRDVGAAAMLLTLTQLRQAADRQTPFTEDLALLRQIAGSQDPELTASIDRMAPYAETGILSAGGLKRELQASANDIITAKLKGEDVSVKEKVMGRLQGLFSIKKDGVPMAGSEERKLIDQASAQLDAGDVAGAMAILQQLDGAAAQAAQPWQNKAAATVAAQALDAQLVNSIIAKVKNTISGVAGGASGAITTSAGPINMAPMQQAPEMAPMVMPDMPPMAPTPAPDVIQQ